MRVYFVGDGDRDEVVLPPLVEAISGCMVEVEYEPWSKIRLHKGKGYKRKLLYALDRAAKNKINVVVAAVDQDKARRRERLKELKEARIAHNDKHGITHVPAAIGEAVPHSEAWLLDDAVAVRLVLNLPPEAPISNVNRSKNPKSDLGDHISASGRCHETLTVLKEIAGRIQEDRCQHRQQTGFQEFAEEVRTAFGVGQ